MLRDFGGTLLGHFLAALAVSAPGVAQAHGFQVVQTPASTYAAKGDQGAPLSVEVVSVIHDPVDLTIALLVRCGPHEGFFTRHHAFLAQQQTILDKVTRERLASWTEADISDRMIHIANDLDLFSIEASLGVSPAAAQACLKDGADIQHVKEMTDSAIKGGVETTPSFRLNGKLLDGVHTWSALRPALGDALPGAGQSGRSPVELVEYVSYTCPHCARYELEADGERSVMLDGVQSQPVPVSVKQPRHHFSKATRKIGRRRTQQAANVCSIPARIKARSGS